MSQGVAVCNCLPKTAWPPTSGGSSLFSVSERCASGLELDLLRLERFLLRQAQRQHAVGELRLDLLGIDGGRQLEVAHEGAVAALDAVILLGLLVLLELALALEREHVAVERDFDLLSLHAGELGRHDQSVLLFVDVDSRRKVGDGRLGRHAATTEEVALELALHAVEVSEGIPGSQHGGTLLAHDGAVHAHEGAAYPRGQTSPRYDRMRMGQWPMRGRTRRLISLRKI